MSGEGCGKGFPAGGTTDIISHDVGLLPGTHRTVAPMGMVGKVIGGTAGFAVGGPIGALLGALAGHAVDKARDRLFAPTAPVDTVSDKTAASQAAFATAVVVLSAKTARADGPVNRREIDAFKKIFHFPYSGIEGAERLFRDAGRHADGFEHYAERIARMLSLRRPELEDLLDCLFRIAEADGPVNSAETAFLRRVSAVFTLPPVAFERVQSLHTVRRKADPYEVLGLSQDVSDDRLKRTYRRLIREHHPDGLVARGMSREAIVRATARMAAINDAYDCIQKERGLK